MIDGVCESEDGVRVGRMFYGSDGRGNDCYTVIERSEHTPHRLGVLLIRAKCGCLVCIG